MLIGACKIQCCVRFAPSGQTHLLTVHLTGTPTLTGRGVTNPAQCRIDSNGGYATSLELRVSAPGYSKKKLPITLACRKSFGQAFVRPLSFSLFFSVSFSLFRCNCLSFSLFFSLSFALFLSLSFFRSLTVCNSLSLSLFSGSELWPGRCTAASASFWTVFTHLSAPHPRNPHGVAAAPVLGGGSWALAPVLIGACNTRCCA